MSRRARQSLLACAAASLLAGPARGQVPTTFTASQTIGDFSTAPLTIDASSTAVDVTQTAGTTLDLFDGGLTKLGSFTASISGSKIVSSAGEIDLDSSGGDFTINSALNGSSLALVIGVTPGNSGRVILGSTDTTNHNFAGGIFLNQGALQISSDANLGANSGNTNTVSFSGGTLEIAGNVNFSAGHNLAVGTAGGTLSVINAGFTATIDDANQLSGSGIFTKEGPGTLRIIGANTLTDSVTVNGGALELQNTGALSAGGSNKTPITLNAGAQLNLRHDGPFPANFGNDVTIGGNAIIDVNQISTGTSGNLQLGALNIGNATLTVSGANRTLEFTGTTRVAGNATVDNGVDVRLGGQLTGNGSLTKRGSGVLSLSGFAPNTYSDVTNVIGGTLELNKDPGTNAVPGDLIINGGTVKLITPGQIADNSNVMLMTGSLQLNNQTDTVSVLHNDGGMLTTGTGSLLVTSPNTTILAAGSTIINPGGRLDSVGLVISGGFNEAQSNGTISVGTAGFTMQGNTSPTVNLDADPTTPGTMVLRSNAAFTGTAGTASILSLGPEPVAGTLDLGGAVRTFTVNDGSAAADMVIGVRIVNGGISKSGAGTLRLTKSNSYANGTTLAGGTLEVTDGSALGSGVVLFQGGALALRSDATTATFAASVSAGSTNSIVVDIGPITSGSAGTLQISSGTFGTVFTANGANGGTLAIAGGVNLQNNVNVTSNVAITFNGAIAQAAAGTFGITKTGTATLTLGGNSNNNYLGATTINSGTLRLAKTSAIAIPANLQINGPSTMQFAGSEQIADTAIVNLNSTAGTAVLDLAGQTETIGGLTGTGSVLLGSGQLIVAPSTATTFNGVISGSGQISKSGPAEFILAGSNAFTGGSTVSGGTLTYSTPSASEIGNTLASGVWTVNAGATLNLTAGANITTNQASVTLSGASSSFPKINSIDTNSGMFAVTNGRSFSTLGGMNNTGTISVGGGAPGSILTITGAVSQLSGNTLTGGNWIVSDGGSLFFNSGGDVITNAAGVTLSGAGSSFPRINNLANNQGQFTITGGRSFITSGSFTNSGTASIATASVLKINGNLTNSGTVDVSGGVIIDYSGASPITTIRTQLRTGFAGGSWTGAGIDSSAAGAVAQDPTNHRKTAVGYAESSALGLNSLLGQSIDSPSVVLLYTLAGDTNLDGIVNTLDFNHLATNYNKSGQFWTAGDTNYDAVVNALDFNAMASNYGAVMSSSAIEAPVVGTLVPEPAALAPLAIFLSSSRRRKSR